MTRRQPDEFETVHRPRRDRLRRGGLPAVQEDHDRLAREAKRIRSAETLIVPGLLQTAEYARGVFARLQHARSEQEIDAAAAV